MKKLVITTVIALLVAGWSIARAQEFPEEYLGLPGDNLNLYAVMKLFQESETLEEFERSLNDENSRINNLDLNGDRMVDYIMVKDFVDGNVHTIVLRAALNKNETQDVAVFTVQQFNDGSVQLQLVGDEALYGRNFIIEPYYTENGETPNPAYIGNAVARENITVVRTTTYEVAAWPIVRYIYHPRYVVWRSSWHWGYYPTYWSPWRPYYWHTYYGYHYNWHNHYYAYYRPWHHHRYPNYSTVYYSRVRTYSPTVVVNINKGVYRNTYSRPDLRAEGEKLYARTNSGRSSANTTSSRVRTSGSTSVQKSANTSASGRRQATVATDRTTTKSATEVRADAIRRSAGTSSGRTNAGTAGSVNVENQRKSATVATERNGRTSVNSTNNTRRTAPSSTERSSVERKTDVRTKAATPASRPATVTPSVRQSSGQRTPSAAGRQANPSVRQTAPAKPSATVSGRSATRSQPAVKSAPAPSTGRSSGTSVGSSRPASRSSAATPSGSSSRSSTSRSGRR